MMGMALGVNRVPVLSCLLDMQSMCQKICAISAWESESTPAAASAAAAGESTTTGAGR